MTSERLKQLRAGILEDMRIHDLGPDLAAIRLNAARYLWLRNTHRGLIGVPRVILELPVKLVVGNAHLFKRLEGHELDAAIDAAIDAGKGRG